MYIGEVAKRTNLSPKAIRLYEEIGLIPEQKRKGRYRIYQESTIEMLLLIKEAKTFGISLNQLKSLTSENSGQLDWAKVATFLRKIKIQMQSEIVTLEKRINALDRCIGEIPLCPDNSLDSAP